MDDNAHQYVVIPAQLIGSNLVPVWKLKHVLSIEDDYELEYYNYEGNLYNPNLRNVVYDLATGTIVDLPIINNYPQVLFEEGDNVAYEINGKIKLDKIKTIEFREESQGLYLGSEIRRSGMVDLSLPENKVDGNTLYYVQFHKPIFIMESKEQISHPMYLKEIIN